MNCANWVRVLYTPVTVWGAIRLPDIEMFRFRPGKSGFLVEGVGFEPT
jgi:hypothetical protein